MRYVTYYHKNTGILCGKSILASDEAAVELNAPKDHVAIDHPPGATLNHLSQKVDVETGEIVGHQQPQTVTDQRGRNAARDRAIAEIRRLEASQGRAIREALLGRGGFDRLRDIDGQIAELRKRL